MPQLDSGPMRPNRKTTRAFVALAAVSALLLGGCGGSSSEKIPQDQADELSRTVEQVRDYAANGRCDEADATLVDAQEQIDSLDASGDVRDGLAQLADNLDRHLAEDCQQVEQTTSSTTTTTTSTTSTTTTPTTSDTTSSDTTSTDTSSTTTSTTQTEPPVSPPPGNGPGSSGPPGQGESGGTAPRQETKAAKHDKKPKPAKPAKDPKEKGT